MKIIPLAVLLTATTGIATACTAAQSQEEDEQRFVVAAPGQRIVKFNSHGIDDMDSDGDGRISQEEYTASWTDRFEAMDADDDGYVDDDELDAWIQSRVDEGIERAMRRVEVIREKWDENGEHLLRLREIEKNLEENLEGLHERLEGMHGPMDFDNDAFIWNGDNGHALRFAMPRFDFRWQGKMLEDLDKDGDGSLSREEFEARKKDPFDILDKDGDGKLSEEELEGPDGHFMVRPYRFRFGWHDDESSDEPDEEL